MAKKTDNPAPQASGAGNAKAEAKAARREQRRQEAAKTADAQAKAAQGEGKRRGMKETWNQLRLVYQMTHELDKNVGWFVTLGAAIPILVSILLPLLFYRHSIAGWILTVITGVILGASGGVWALSKRWEKVAFNQLDGRHGSTAAVLSQLNNKAYTFDQEPVWVDPRTMDMVWIGTSLSGVYLVGEGDYGRLQRAMDAQEKKLKGYTQGSAIPIYRICVGDGEKQVPLNKVRREITHHRKVAMRPDERQQLDNRIRSLRKRNSTMNMPKGMDPSRAKVSPRALRGR